MGTAEEKGKGKEQINPLVRKRAGKRADVNRQPVVQATLPAATIFRGPKLGSGGQRRLHSALFRDDFMCFPASGCFLRDIRRLSSVDTWDCDHWQLSGSINKHVYCDFIEWVISDRPRIPGHLFW